MPEVTDPRLLQQLNSTAPPVAAPLRVPGTVPPPPRAEAKVLDNTKTAQDIVLDQNQDARADTSLGLSQQSNAREQARFERQEAEAAITGGVDPTESEATAGFLTTQLENHFKTIGEVLRRNPDAAKPGWLETGASLFGERARNLAIPDEVLADRQILNDRYGLSVDVLLTLGTGAAYTAEQKAQYVESYAPQVTDTPENIADKAKRMKEAIVAARVKSGVSTIQVDKALEMVDQLYGQAAGTAEAKPTEMKISTEKDSIPVPDSVQSKYAAFMNSVPRGQLTVDQYLQARKQLDEEARKELGVYFEEEYDPIEAQVFVDAFNKGENIDLTLPPYERELSPAEGTISDLVDSEGGAAVVNFANAMTGGGVEALTSPSEKDKFRLLNENNPYGSTGGDILGSLAPSAALQKVGTKLGMGAFKAGLAADTGYNALRGFNNDGAEGAITQGALGALGNIGGTLAFKGAKGFMGDTTALDSLSDVELTNLQRMGLGKLEEVGQGLPFVRKAREDSIASWTVDKANKVLKPFGASIPKDVKPGFDTNKALNTILNQRYNNIRPQIKGPIDQTFRNGAAALERGNVFSDVEKTLFNEVMAAIDPLLKSNSYDGIQFKDVDQKLRQLSSDWIGMEAGPGVVSPSAYHNMGRVAEKMRQQLRAQVGRNSPEVAGELKKLDRAWAESMRLENASTRAGSADGVYSPSQLLQSIKVLDRSKGKSAFARGEALGQKSALQAAEVLGSKPVPEGISWLQLGGALAAGGGGGYLNPAIPLGVGATAASLYAPGLKKLTGKVLGDRPDAMQKTILGMPLDDLSRAALARYLAQQGSE